MGRRAYRNRHWKSRVQAYMTVGLEDEPIREPYKEAMAKLRDVVAVELSTANEIVASCKAWKKKLRNGGTAILCERLLAWAYHQRDTAGAGGVSRDVGQAICEVASLADPLGKSKDVQALRTTCAAAVAADEDRQAFAKLQEALRAHDGEKMPLLSDATYLAIVACKNRQIPSDWNIQTVLGTFCGLMAVSMVTAIKQNNTKPANWDKYVEAYSGVLEAAKEMIGEEGAKALPNYNLFRYGNHYPALATDSVECKNSFSALRPPVEGEEFDEDLAVQHVSAALAKRKALVTKIEDITVVSRASAPPQAIDIAEYMHNFFEQTDGKLREQASHCFKCLKKMVVHAQGKLMKVSGGTDDGKSWKDKVGKETSLSNMQAALDILAAAYGEAIMKRIAVAHEVAWCRVVQGSGGHRFCQSALGAGVDWSLGAARRYVFLSGRPTQGIVFCAKLHISLSERGIVA